VAVDIGSAGVIGPAWSPDGSAILFATISDGQLGTMYVAAPDGSHTAVVSGTAGGAFPNWTDSTP
jgi:Tol biopolymer transport system component